MAKKAQDLTGQKFGKLKVTARNGTKHGKAAWLCECECGRTTTVDSSSLKRGSTTTCGCTWRIKGEGNPLFKGYKEISKAYWTNIVLGAKQRNIEFDITIEYTWKLFEQQNRKCKLSNLDLSFVSSYEMKSGIKRGTASLDRIDSSKGYVEGNVQWVHKDVNKMKQSFTQERLIELCSRIFNQWQQSGMEEKRKL